jgi:hypothetical protein
LEKYCKEEAVRTLYRGKNADIVEDQVLEQLERNQAENSPGKSKFGDLKARPKSALRPT